MGAPASTLQKIKMSSATLQNISVLSATIKARQESCTEHNEGSMTMKNKEISLSE
jgi:flagellar motility protein MotE (MotC chaperone)